MSDDTTKELPIKYTDTYGNKLNDGDSLELIIPAQQINPTQQMPEQRIRTRIYNVLGDGGEQLSAAMQESPAPNMKASYVLVDLNSLKQFIPNLSIRKI
jgi:uncharacterized Zn ribbon protein